MKEHVVGIIMNGVTGRMGKNQHLLRSILEIRKNGGLPLNADEIVIPNPILLGRTPQKLKELARSVGLNNFTTSLDTCLADKNYPVYFDTQTTGQRPEAVKKAIAAGKAIYCEKPTATNLNDALELYKLAQSAGVKNGVVQDKLWLPGIIKLKNLIDSGFFGIIHSVRCEFGYWVFDGFSQPAQRPSWNYRKEDGGGIILDMFAHWRYLIDNLFGPIKKFTALGATHIDKRADEFGKTYKSTAEDAAYAIFELENGTICHFNSSWVVRVRRDDLFTMQIDGSKGSAVTGLRKCWTQSENKTPRPVWNPDVVSTLNYYDDWQEIANVQNYDNAFKIQWELFLKHVVKDEPFPWTLLEGAKGVQLAELAYASWHNSKWVDVPPLD